MKNESGVFGKKIDLRSLKEVTEKTQTELKESNDPKTLRERVEREIEAEKKVQEAEHIIRLAPYLINEAAHKGNNKVNICSLDYSKDFDLSRKESLTGNRFQRKHLGIRGAMVWDYLEQNGLNPEFHYEHDGFGIRDWYYIRANW